MIAKTSGETAVLDSLEEALGPWAQKILGVVGAARGISLVDSGRVNGRNSMPDGTNNDQSPNDSPSPESRSRLAGNTVMQLEAVSSVLSSAASFQREADTLRDCYETAIRPTDFGGLGLDPNHALTQEEKAEVVFLLSAQLEALNSVDRAKTPVLPLSERPNGRRGMTLSEKIFAAHDVARTGYVKPGDIIRVDVDWILASELSWGGMEQWYDKLGKPGIFRNDRFWLAGDHVVDPRIMEHPKIKPLIKSSERAKRDFKMTENQGMNYTIMHTEFCRERAQPGMLVIGSDSHTCSAGSVSALAIGLGVADVLLPLVTGETWFRIPETVNIRFINQPRPGIGGKDVILYILKELKRNTVASDRIVEYTGPGVEHLSCDARFAIANMTTEFGGVSGIFVPDHVTKTYIESRKLRKYKSDAVYFRPDDDAEYAATHTIDLSLVESFVARYPKPDDVVPVSEMQGTKLQGCFIGACTTAEEDLVLAALVLEEGLKRGLKPVKQGKRRVTPGSRPILHHLRKSGLADVYEQAGFEIGVPGCSYCVGMAADRADEGETWLSSQNRNFENRMGPGAFGNISSAVTVAASSFNMEITNPLSLLDSIDMKRVQDILSYKQAPTAIGAHPTYVEPGATTATSVSQDIETHPHKKDTQSTKENGHDAAPLDATNDKSQDLSHEISQQPKPASPSLISGKIALLGDFIDTDALAPSEALIKPGITPEELGKYCLYHTHPEFRRQVREEGHTIVVAGEAFGCGSSRENAVTALQGVGVQCVIARSFAFIYGRNQPNLGLLGFEMQDPRFWELVADGKQISVDLDSLLVAVDVDGGEGKTESFPFQLSLMQRRLIEVGGAEKAFAKWGKGLWEVLTAKDDEQSGHQPKSISAIAAGLETNGDKAKLEW